MRLGEFLSAARPAPFKPVKFKIIGKGPNGEPVTADADAVMVFIDEHERQKARMEALAQLKKDYPDSDPPSSTVSDEMTYHFLWRVLRDSSDPQYRVLFAENPRTLKNALVFKVAIELDQLYQEWVAQEFPDAIGQEDFDRLKEDAKKKSLADLLSESGFSLIHRALPSLAALYGKSPMQT